MVGEAKAHFAWALVLREEEKSDLAHPSRGTLFFTRPYHLQAAGELEQRCGFLATVNHYEILETAY